MDLFLTNMQLFTSQEEIDVMQNFSKSDEETNSSTSWYMRVSTFSANFNFGVNYSFKYE